MKSFIVITCKKFYSYHVSSFVFLSNGSVAIVLAADFSAKIINAKDILSVEMAHGVVNGEYTTIK